MSEFEAPVEAQETRTEIKHVGSSLKADSDGFIVSQSDLEKIQEQWLRAAEEMVDVCRAVLGDTLHSVYVRGSASRGEAIDGVSDLDLIMATTVWPTDQQWLAIRQEREALEKKYSFCTKIETDIHLLSEVMSGEDGVGKTLKIYSACIYGSSFIDSLPPIRMDRMAVKSVFRFNDQIKRRLEKIEAGELLFSKQVCSWMMKRILRAGGALVLEREKAYTRDLYPCYALFAKYYPDKEPQMREVLEYALNPTDNVKEVEDLIGGFADWLEEEIRRVYGAL